MSYLLSLGLAWMTAAVDAQQTRAWIRQLDDPRFEARADADLALRQAGLRVVPLLQEELKAQPPLEVARRLQGIINHYIRPDWHERVNEAVAEAQRTGKPILVVSLPATGNDPDQWAPPVVGDRELAYFLKQHYVVVWHVNQGVYVGGPNGGHLEKFSQTYCCAADGKVLQVHAGIPGLDLLAERDGKARVLSMQPVPAPEEEALDRVTPNGDIAVRIKPGVQKVQQDQLQVLQVQLRYGYRGRGHINPIGMAIQDVLGVGNLQIDLR